MMFENKKITTRIDACFIFFIFQCNITNQLSVETLPIVHTWVWQSCCNKAPQMGGFNRRDWIVSTVLRLMSDSESTVELAPPEDCGREAILSVSPSAVALSQLQHLWCAGMWLTSLPSSSQELLPYQSVTRFLRSQIAAHNSKCVTNSVYHAFLHLFREATHLFYL